VIYELRIYSCFSGRLPALHKRFQDHTVKLFEKHGIKNIGYWTTEVGDSNHELTYLVAFEDANQRQEAWASFHYAELLLERDGPGDREKATELQDNAISIAQGLGMSLLLGKVLAQREILKA